MHGLRRSLTSCVLRRWGQLPCLLALCTTIGSAAGAQDPLLAQRAQFQQAMAQLADPATGPIQDSAELRRYVLYPYLEAARLETGLRAPNGEVPAALDVQVAAFLRARDAEPVAQGLRRSWLASLALRSQWREFLQFHDDSADGAILRCHGFTARIELGADAQLASRIAQAWLTPRSMPECERAFAWLEGSARLTAAMVEQRVRLALEADNADFARQIAARLPAAQAAPLLQWAALLENPQREIDALIAAPRRPVEPAALLAGWIKLARANRDVARQRFSRLVQARHLDRRAASPLALALALALSWDRDANALRYFSQVEAADFDDAAREWQARAALWAHDWKQVARSIAAMSEDSRNSTRWRYWSARALAHAGDQQAARQIYESILRTDNYYSAMAAARLRQPVAPDVQPLPAETALLADFEGLPPFVRARELLLAGLADSARAEWRVGHESLAPAHRSQAIHLAARWGWYEQAIAVATGEKVFNDYALLYPTPYDEQVAAAAQHSGLAASLIYGVIRQESLYQRDALSGAGARGLMQLNLDTARRTARQWRLPAPTAASLFEPAVNVPLGAAHLKEMLDRFDGQLPLALAGYNAGPNAARRWLPTTTKDPDIWIENIPYNETRGYVQRILWHTVVFSWLRDGQAQDTSGWLKPIRP